MKKNILYICPSSGIGGAETFLKATARHRDPENFENTYLLFSPGPLEEELRSMGATVECLPRVPRLSKPSGHSAVSQKINQLLQKKNIHLAHSTMAYGALFAARPLKKNKTPHAWFQHGPASGWMDRLAGVLPHKVLFTNSSYTTEKQLQLEAPVRALVPKNRKIVKILLGSDDLRATVEKKMAAKKNLLKTLGRSDNPVIASMLCRIQKWKGVHVLLEALSLLRANNPNAPLLVCIWGDAFGGNTYLEDLKKTASDQQLPVHFMGLTKSPPQALLASDVVVNASIQPEPFGLSIIEAMAAMTAVIVPKEGGPMEILADSDAGLFFKPRNAQSLCDALEKITPQETLSLFQQNAHRRFIESFTAERMVKEIEAAYTAELGGR